MDLKAYAKAVRRFDWTYEMSDDGAAKRRAQKRKSDLSALVSESVNHARVWELGSGYHAKYVWSPSEDCTVETRFESGWRWVGAYLWALGLRLSEDEAKALVSPVDAIGEHSKRPDPGRPDWVAIDATVAAAEVAA